MIRQYNNKLVVIESDGTTLNLADIYCNSDDTKPTENLANGSKLTEVDTGKTYLFDEDNEEWVEYSAGGGGTGGGGAKIYYFSGEQNAVVYTDLERTQQASEEVFRNDFESGTTILIARVESYEGGEYIDSYATPVSIAYNDPGWVLKVYSRQDNMPITAFVLGDTTPTT